MPARYGLVALRENYQPIISFIPITTNFPSYYLSLAREVFPDGLYPGFRRTIWSQRLATSLIMTSTAGFSSTCQRFCMPKIGTLVHYPRRWLIVWATSTRGVCWELLYRRNCIRLQSGQTQSIWPSPSVKYSSVGIDIQHHVATAHSLVQVIDGYMKSRRFFIGISVSTTWCSERKAAMYMPFWTTSISL